MDETVSQLEEQQNKSAHLAEIHNNYNFPGVYCRSANTKATVFNITNMPDNYQHGDDATIECLWTYMAGKEEPEECTKIRSELSAPGWSPATYYIHISYKVLGVYRRNGKANQSVVTNREQPGTACASR